MKKFTKLAIIGAMAFATADFSPATDPIQDPNDAKKTQSTPVILTQEESTEILRICDVFINALQDTPQLEGNCQVLRTNKDIFSHTINNHSIPTPVAQEHHDQALDYLDYALRFFFISPHAQPITGETLSRIAAGYQTFSQIKNNFDRSIPSKPKSIRHHKPSHNIPNIQGIVLGFPFEYQ
jgi:hypothetical protein